MKLLETSFDNFISFLDKLNTSIFSVVFITFLILLISFAFTEVEIIFKFWTWEIFKEDNSVCIFSCSVIFKIFLFIFSILLIDDIFLIILLSIFDKFNKLFIWLSPSFMFNTLVMLSIFSLFIFFISDNLIMLFIWFSLNDKLWIVFV